MKIIEDKGIRDDAIVPREKATSLYNKLREGIINYVYEEFGTQIKKIKWEFKELLILKSLQFI